MLSVRLVAVHVSQGSIGNPSYAVGAGEHLGEIRAAITGEGGGRRFDRPRRRGEEDVLSVMPSVAEGSAATRSRVGL